MQIEEIHTLIGRIEKSIVDALNSRNQSVIEFTREHLYSEYCDLISKLGHEYESEHSDHIHSCFKETETMFEGLDRLSVIFPTIHQTLSLEQNVVINNPMFDNILKEVERRVSIFCLICSSVAQGKLLIEHNDLTASRIIICPINNLNSFIQNMRISRDMTILITPSALADLSKQATNTIKAVKAKLELNEK